MDRQTALPSFQTQMRKATWGLLGHDSERRQNGNGTPDERTPLVNGNGSAPRNNGGKHHGPAWEFFFNSKDTPGCDSPKPWVKYPAHVWHITKATLLSSS